MGMFKKAASVLLSALLMVSLTSCGSGASSEGEGGAPSQLKVGMECAYAPFNWMQTDDANGAVPIEGGGFAGGYDVEVAKVIAEKLGRELVIVKTEWEGLVPGITSGKLDLIIAGMSPTEERKATIDFSDHYYTSDIVVVLKKDSAYASAASIADFKGAKITGQLGTLHYDFIDQMEGVDKQSAMKDFGTMIAAVSSDKIDGYVSERPGAMSAVMSNPDLAFVSFEQGNGFDTSVDEISISVGLKKDSSIKNDVNAAIGGIDDATRQKFMADAIKNQPAA